MVIVHTTPMPSRNISTIQTLASNRNPEHSAKPAFWQCWPITTGNFYSMGRNKALASLKATPAACYLGNLVSWNRML